MSLAAILAKCIVCYNMLNNSFIHSSPCRSSCSRISSISLENRIWKNKKYYTLIYDNLLHTLIYDNLLEYNAKKKFLKSQYLTASNLKLNTIFRYTYIQCSSFGCVGTVIIMNDGVSFLKNALSILSCGFGPK